MQSPAIISLMSIIPGLGLWMIGKRDHAISVIMIFLGLTLVYFSLPWRMITILACNLAIVLWIVQASYAGYEARIALALKSGELEEAKDVTPISLPPSDLSRFEKEVFKAKEIVCQQLNAGEYILDAVPATQLSAFLGEGSYCLYYLGLLKDQLLVVNTDFMGRPAGVEHFGFSTIQDLKVKHGLIQDNLVIVLKSKESVRFKVTRWLRDHTDNFVSMFSKQKSLQL